MFRCVCVRLIPNASDLPSFSRLSPSLSVSLLASPLVLIHLSIVAAAVVPLPLLLAAQTDLVAAGFDPHLVLDGPLFFRCDAERRFVTLDARLYDDICQGRVRL